MHSSNFAKFLLVLGLALPLNECSTKKDASKILFGHVASDGLYPFSLAMYKYRSVQPYYMSFRITPVQIRDEYPYCMANALTSRWIISACHCLTHYTVVNEVQVSVRMLDPVKNRDDMRSVTGGSTKLDDDTNAKFQSRKIIAFNIHRNCGKSKARWKDDIGGGFLEKPWVTNPNSPSFGVEPVQFFTHVKERAEHHLQDIVSSNTTCYVSGFGQSLYFKDTYLFDKNKTLKESGLVFRFRDACYDTMCHNDPELCQKQNYTKVEDMDANAFCGFTEKGYRGGLCYGDSGSVATCDDLAQLADPGRPPKVRRFAVGVGSHSHFCGFDPFIPSDYVKLVDHWPFLATMDKRFIHGLDSPALILEQCPTFPNCSDAAVIGATSRAGLRKSWRRKIIAISLIFMRL